MRALPLALGTIFAAALLPLAAAEAPLLSILKDRDSLQNVPFPEVIELTTGHQVLPVDKKARAGLLLELGTAFDATIRALNTPSHPIHTAGRINEASRFLEDELRRQLNAIPGWTCKIPRTEMDREQRSGYPDLRVETRNGTVFFLDPKLYARGSRASSLRTFYYEPKALTGKIHEDAMHLLLGIEHSGADARHLRLQKWELVDLSGLKVQLKAEFQASNRDVYSDRTVIAHSQE
jgi:hypothetical protein